VASVQLDPASRQYRVRFRFNGKAYFRSLKTSCEREAESRCGSVERTLYAIEQGYLTVPQGVDPADFILSDGRLVVPAVIDLSQPGDPRKEPATLKRLFTAYERELTPDAKEANTLDTERVHRRHLEKHFGDPDLVALDHRAVQGYVNVRAAAGVAPKTIRMELGTLRLVWNWGSTNDHAPPVSWQMKKLTFPKATPREPFQTWEQIERKIQAGRRRGGWKREEEAALWECLFLDEDQIKACLEHVGKNAIYPFVHPMFAFCAFTGARRSELLRSEREDWDFKSGSVAIRQKKSDNSKRFTIRHVPIHPTLGTVMTEWFGRHPGGPFTLCTSNRKPVGPRMATKYFSGALAKSRWEVVPGFHCFRHSLASIMASRGVDQRLINDILGHSTEDMVRRYRHLFPQNRERTIGQLFA